MKAKLSLLILFILLSCHKEVKQKAELKNSDTSSVNRLYKQFVANKIGDTLDVHNNVYVFYNKSMNNTSGRNLTVDGYNLGLKWQCVEFVKRYYFKHLNHKMPNSYGHAKDFFNIKLKDGAINSDRNLMQFSNGSNSKPKLDDLVIFDGNMFNPYGHVAIISKVGADEIEIVQQNVGRNSRENFDLYFKKGKWIIDDSSNLGWLRKSNH